MATTGAVLGTIGIAALMEGSGAAGLDCDVDRGDGLTTRADDIG